MNQLGAFGFSIHEVVWEAPVLDLPGGSIEILAVVLKNRSGSLKAEHQQY